MLVGWIFRLYLFGFPSYFLLISKKLNFCWGIYSTQVWRILPRDVRTLTFCQRMGVSVLNHQKVKLVAGEQKATKRRNTAHFCGSPKKTQPLRGVAGGGRGTQCNSMLDDAGLSLAQHGLMFDALACQQLGWQFRCFFWVCPLIPGPSIDAFSLFFLIFVCSLLQKPVD